MLRLNRKNWAQLCDHATQEYPSECCGVITRSETEEVEVRRCTNIQDRLHQKMPEKHPRDSRTAYRMDDMEVFKILEEAEGSGKKLAGFYHSHIECDAYFSEEDQKAAIFGDEPAYPGVVYLVLSVYNLQVKGYKLFSWDLENRGYEEIPVIIDS